MNSLVIKRTVNFVDWLVGFMACQPLVGLFYAKVSLTIMVSNVIQYKNVPCQPLLGYFMPSQFNYYGLQ